MRKPRLAFLYILLGVLLISLSSCLKRPFPKENNALLFNPVDARWSTIDFVNTINDTGSYTPFNTLYIYNGGGAGMGDLNNDGLNDLVLISNQGQSQLYINLGDMQFEEVSKEVGFTPKSPWATGVAIADINGDNWLDIYVCRSGAKEDEDLTNECYINQGNGTFSEMASQIGLDYNGGSSQAYFFDLDLDGDLDMYLVNHPQDFQKATDFFFYQYPDTSITDKDRLYIQEDGLFTDVSDSFGISDYNGFGLSAICHDFNDDGYPDIFVANDFFATDRLWINQEGKGFVDSTAYYFDKQTLFSMGSDLIDLDGDLTMDFLVADMAPMTAETSKTKMFDLGLDWYQANQRFFGIQQITKNAAYLSRPGHFFEISDFVGLSRTEWSWSVIASNFSNDKLPEVFISNGLKRDFHDNDAHQRLFDNQAMFSFDGNPTYLNLIQEIPQRTVPNLLYRLDSSSSSYNAFHFIHNQTANTQGVCIGDLDNDGDLDMVWNNTDTTASILQNNTIQKGKEDNPHFLRVKASMPKNTQCIGCYGILYFDSTAQRQNIYSQRGYLSSSEAIAHFGLGQQTSTIDSLKWYWVDGSHSLYSDLPVDTLLVIAPKNPTPDLTALEADSTKKLSWLKESFIPSLSWSHKEDAFDEFRRHKLNPFKLSTNNPKLLVNDFDQDGKDDLLIMNSAGFSNIIFWQDNHGEFVQMMLPKPPLQEARDGVAVDLNQDGLLDIVTVGGGNHSDRNLDYAPCVYMQDSSRHFVRCDTCHNSWLNRPIESVKLVDIDGQPPLEIALGASHDFKVYGQAQESAIVQWKNGILDTIWNDNLGLITSIESLNDKELIWTSEWGPVYSMKWNKLEEEVFIEVDTIVDESGYWSSAIRLVSQGDTANIYGNLGLNTMLQASKDKPISLRIGDFDQDGKPEPIIRHFIGDNDVFFPSRREFCMTMPAMNRLFPTHHAFALGQWNSLAASNMYPNQSVIQTQTLAQQHGLQSLHRYNTDEKLQMGPVIDFVAINDSMCIVLTGSNKMYYRLGNLSSPDLLATLTEGEIVLEEIPPLDNIRYPIDGNLITIDGAPYVIISANQDKLRLFSIDASHLDGVFSK